MSQTTSHLVSIARSFRLVEKPLLGILSLTLLLHGAASADTYTVLNLNDSGAGSLRAAVSAANANVGGDTIEFDAGLNGTILLSSPIDVTGDSSLLILGDDRIEIDGQAQNRLFTIQLDDVSFNRNVTLNKLTLRNGLSNGGGAIFVSGWNATVVLQETDIYDCAAVTTGDARGGAILARFGGNVVLQSAVLKGNQASLHGGAIATDTQYITTPNFTGSISIHNSVLADNTALSGHGGALFIDSGIPTQYVEDPQLPEIQHLTIIGSRFTRNSAGLGRSASGQIQPTVRLSDDSKGSAIYLLDQARDAESMEYISGAADVSSTIGKGGYKVLMSHSTVDANQSSNGPTIFIRTHTPSDEYPSVEFVNSTISGNLYGTLSHASIAEGATADPYNHPADVRFFSGIVHLGTEGPTEPYDSNDTVGPNQGLVRLHHVTISGNFVPHSPLLTNSAKHRLSAGLAIGNRTFAGDHVGEVDYTQTGPLRVLLENSILSGNYGLAGIDPTLQANWNPTANYWPANGVQLEAVGSLIATQVNGSHDHDEAFFHIVYGFDTAGGPFSNDTVAVGAVIADDPLLEPLGNNGGPPLAGDPAWFLATRNPFVDTAVPANSSPAIDAADASLCAVDDERGRARSVDIAGVGYDGPGDDACDIGAVETSNDRPLLQVWPQSDSSDIFDNGQTAILANKTLFGPVLQNGTDPSLTFVIRNNNFQGGGAYSILDVTTIDEQPSLLQQVFSVQNVILPLALSHLQTATFDVVCDASLAPGIYTRTLQLVSDSVAIDNSPLPPLDDFRFDVQCVIETGVSDIFVRNANSHIEVPDGSTANLAAVHFGPGQHTAQPSPPTLAFEIRNLAAPSVMDTLDLASVTTNSSVITVTSPPNATNITPGASSLFGLTCDNTNEGMFSATVTISSDTEQTPSEDPYTFDVFCEIGPPPPMPALTVVEAPAIPLPEGGTVDLGSTTPSVPLFGSVMFQNTGDDLSSFDIAGLMVTGDPEIQITPIPPLAPTANIFKDPVQGGSFDLLLQCVSLDPDTYTAQVAVQIRGLASSLITRTFQVECLVGALPTLALVPVVDLVAEGNTLLYDLVLSAPLAVDLPVDFVTAGNGADPVSSADFDGGYPLDTTTIPAGSTNLATVGYIELPTVVDTLVEPTEELVLAIAIADSAPPSAVLITVDQQPGFIEDAPVVEVPISGPAGRAALILLLIGAAAIVLRRT